MRYVYRNALLVMIKRLDLYQSENLFSRCHKSSLFDLGVNPSLYLFAERLKITASM